MKQRGAIILILRLCRAALAYSIKGGTKMVETLQSRSSLPLIFTSFLSILLFTYDPSSSILSCEKFAHSVNSAQALNAPFLF